jgi:hypothetical protein
MKEFIISLILTNGTLLDVKIYDTSCENWFTNNITIHEKEIKFLNQNHYYHTYKDKIIIGYYCK